MEGGDFVDTSAKHVEDDDDNDGEKDEEQNSSGENGANVREEIEPDGDEVGLVLHLSRDESALTLIV